ncbi:MAG: hypothetical protein ABF379_08780, partial [Akkermansiaceae bacterium]
MVLLFGGMMIGSVGLSVVVPAGVPHETELDLQGWGISLGLTLFMSGAFFLTSARLAKKIKRGNMMRRREAMALVGVGWLVCSLVTAFP